MAGEHNVDSSAVMAAYLAREYAYAIESQLSAAERRALEALRGACAEVRFPLSRELVAAGSAYAAPEADHVPSALVAALLETPASPGRIVTATELCAQMGRIWTRGARVLGFLRLLCVLADRMPATADQDLGGWLVRVAQVRAARRRVTQLAGIGVVLAGCGIVVLGARMLRR